jgi:truncated hemoglobin YjbI
MLMSDWVSGPGDIESRIRNTARFARRDADPLGNQKFHDGLEHFSISAVCLNQDSQRADEVRATLQRTGFEMRESIEQYEIWSRKLPRNSSRSGSNDLTGS